jgi:hypothetical protein
VPGKHLDENQINLRDVPNLFVCKFENLEKIGKFWKFVF